ncbi:MAG: hypothetical protein JWO31_2000 [Phycisphaerales bacterium]|nr:hypothetical protein [Phycisphaerales bacterium]
MIEHWTTGIGTVRAIHRTQYTAHGILRHAHPTNTTPGTVAIQNATRNGAVLAGAMVNVRSNVRTSRDTSAPIVRRIGGHDTAGRSPRRRARPFTRPGPPVSLPPMLQGFYQRSADVAKGKGREK